MLQAVREAVSVTEEDEGEDEVAREVDLAVGPEVV